jgi:hypothetical protein
MIKEDIFSFSQLWGVLGVAVPMATGLFLRDLEKDLTGGCPQITFKALFVRLLARISGSTAGAWYASAIVIAFGYGWLEFPAIGLGAVLGWKILDASSRVTLLMLRKPLREFIKL